MDTSIRMTSVKNRHIILPLACTVILKHLFVCFFRPSWEFFSNIETSHYQWKAANLDMLCKYGYWAVRVYN